MSEEKKDKKSKVATALSASLDVIAPEIDEGTVLRFDITIDADSETERTYTYTALYVDGKWFVSGEGRILNTKYTTTIEFFTALSKWKAKKIEVATKFDRLR